MTRLMQDVRYALRVLVKSPGFTAVAIITLALGIGANTAIFSVVNGVLLAPLPYAEPDRLVAIWEHNPRFPHTSISYPNFLDWQREARSFEQMIAFDRKSFDLTRPGTPEHINGKEVSANFFATLGVKLAFGREFTPHEDQHGGAPVVIISNRLWRNRFGSSAQVLGKVVALDGVDYTVIGVAPPSFEFEGKADVYTPLGQGDRLLVNPRGSHNGILAVARLRPGVSMAQAQAEMSTIQSRLDQLYPDADRELGTDVEPLKQQIVGNAGGTLLLLFGAVGLVLLIACANYANLLLARSATRRREFAVRRALGAGRARVVMQLLTEGVLLSAAGGVLGLMVAVWGIPPLLAILPGSVPRSETVRLNAPVLLFTFGVAFAVGVLFGLAPALKSSKVDLEASIREGSRGSTGVHHRLQSGLVIGQVALTLVLLAGSGLLFRTIRHLWEADPGFDTQHVITFKVGIPPSAAKTGSTLRIAYRQLLERLRTVPGVEGADFTLLVPLSGFDNDCPFWIGSQRPARQTVPRMLVFNTGPDYLRTMGIPLVRGRFFTPRDTIKSPCVAAIDSVFARTYFPGQDPLGQTLTFGWTPPFGPCQIVGVVGHVKHWGLGDEKLTQAESYYPLYQIPDEWWPIGNPWTTIIVRTRLEAAALMPAIKRAVYGVGSGQTIYDVQTVRDIASHSMSSQRFPMILLGIFAALALLLASVGIYGVISYSVTERVQEIGIRMALGAAKRDVFRIVIGQGLRLALAGLAIGVVIATILARVLPSFSGLLYGVKAGDPLTFAAVSLVLTGVAVLACYIPARRATRVDPLLALRHE